jgi:hypothetical protein
MRVLVACEFSGVVRDAFAHRGHDAWSCDLLPSEKGGQHIQGDILQVLREREFDLMVAHPPCTYLCVSGSGWFYHPDDKALPIEQRRPHPKYPNRRKDQAEAVAFFMALVNAPIARIAVENPVGVMSKAYRKPDQIIQPYMFGDEASKGTCLWLKNLPILKPTKIVGKGEFIVHKSGVRKPKWFADALHLSPEERMKARSRTFQGFAEAMAEQWGGQTPSAYQSQI